MSSTSLRPSPRRFEHNMIRPLHTATRGSHLIASTSRLPLRAVHTVIPAPSATAQFTIPPLLPFPIPTSSPYKGKGKASDPKRHNEDEVDDAEWEMRVGRGMLHLRETLPLILRTGDTSIDLFPPDIYSHNVVLKLPAPLPIRISSLPAYTMAFAIARNGMHAFHTDLHTTMDRMTFPNSPPSSSSLSRLLLARKPMPTHRQRQIRVHLSLYGTPRFPPNKESIWRTSSLYTFSPYSGLIASHEVETIRPLPGEGVSEWLMNRLLGWTSRQNEGLAPCPRAVPVRLDSCRRSETGKEGE